MRAEIFRAYTYIANINYYLNPDLVFPHILTGAYSLIEIKRRKEKIIDRIRDYGIKAYNDLKKIL